jgi:hypothetical protein
VTSSSTLAESVPSRVPARAQAQTGLLAETPSTEKTLRDPLLAVCARAVWLCSSRKRDCGDVALSDTRLGTRLSGALPLWAAFLCQLRRCRPVFITRAAWSFLIICPLFCGTSILFESTGSCTVTSRAAAPNVVLGARFPRRIVTELATQDGRARHPRTSFPAAGTAGRTRPHAFRGSVRALCT